MVFVGAFLLTKINLLIDIETRSHNHNCNQLQSSVSTSLVPRLTFSHVLRVMERECLVHIVCTCMCQITPKKWGDWILLSHVCDTMITSVECVGSNNWQQIRQCDMTYALSSYRMCLHEMSMQFLFNSAHA